jgi:thioredoxin-related protein
MRSFKRSPAYVVLLTIVFCFLAGVPQIAGQSKYVPVSKYDPKRDAAADISAAIREAQSTQKRILLEVGGDWCSWCHTLDRLFEANPNLLLLRDQNFVTVKINYSEENENKEVLSHYGPVESFPYLFVLDRDGKLLLSKETGALESGKSYDLKKLTAFLKEWAPAIRR